MDGLATRRNSALPGMGIPQLGGVSPCFFPEIDVYAWIHYHPPNHAVINIVPMTYNFFGNNNGARVGHPGVEVIFWIKIAI